MTTISTYRAAPIGRSEVSRENSLSVARVTVTGALILEVQQALAVDPRILTGAYVCIRRFYPTLPLDDEESYRTVFGGQVTKWDMDEAGSASVEVSDRWFNWNSSVSSRTHQKLCGFKFGGDRCLYPGSEIECDKTLTSCQGYGNQANFGGFKEIHDVRFKGLL